MQETILISIAVEDLQTIIIDSVNACLRHHKFDKEEKIQESVFLTIDEASSLLNLSKQTIYGLASQRKIPFCKKGKRLYFSRDEILEWVKKGRKKTVEEIRKEVGHG